MDKFTFLVGVLVVFSLIGFILDLTRYGIGYNIKPDPKILEKREFKVPLTVWLRFSKPRKVL